MGLMFKWFIGINAFILFLNYTVSAVRNSQSPSLSHLIAIIAMIYLISRLNHTLKLSGATPVFRFIGKFLVFIFKPIQWLFVGFLNPTKGSRWAKWWETYWLLNRNHTGFVLDGKNKKLSEKASYNNLLCASPVESGKTSVLALSNIFHLAGTGASMIIMDVKPSKEDSGMGELYRLSSGYLNQKNYNLKVFNLMDVSRSIHFNPLAHLSKDEFLVFNEIQAIANIVIETANGKGEQNGSQKYWTDSAKKHTVNFINALKAISEQDERYKRYFNLVNVRHLLGQCNFFDDRKKGLSDLDNFMLQAGAINPSVSQEYTTALNGNPTTLASEISSAVTALSSLSNPSLASLMGSSDFSFDELRDKKTALFINVNVTDLEQGTFDLVVKIFFNQLLNSLRHSLKKADQPVFMMLDEIGHFAIDNLPGFMGTAREYKVAVMILLQNINQLNSHYGENRAKTIRENALTQLCFGGSKGETARYFSDEAGRTRFAAKQRGADFSLHREDTVITPSEITTAKSENIFCTYAKSYPMKFKANPYYRHPKYRKYAQLKPLPIPKSKKLTVPIIDLEEFSRQTNQPFEPEAFHPDPDTLATDHEQ